MEVNNYELQAEEIESLQYIYPEEFDLQTERPFKFEIMLNSNTESEDLNYLKLRVSFDL